MKHPNDATAKRIIDCAGKRFFKDGYNALMMDRLAQELGLSKKTLYVYFENKDAIATAIIHDFAVKLHHQINIILDDKSLDFNSRIEALIACIASGLKKMNPRLPGELERFAPEVSKKMDEFRNKRIPEIWKSIFRQGIEEGYVRPEVDPAFAAEILLHAIRGMVNSQSVSTKNKSLQTIIKQTLAIIINGVRTDFQKKIPIDKRKL